MKSLILGISMVLSLGAQAQNILNINGRYIDSEFSSKCAEHIKNSGVSGEQFMTNIYLVPNQNEEVSVTTTKTVDGVTMNFGGTDTFLVDGKEHFLSGPGDESDDYYFQKYQAVVQGDAITFNEEGSNNNSDYKRVDTYKTQTSITSDVAGNFVVKMNGKQFTPDGRLALECEIETSYEKVH